jgi:hypothetical protein
MGSVRFPAVFTAFSRALRAAFFWAGVCPSSAIKPSAKRRLASGSDTSIVRPAGMGFLAPLGKSFIRVTIIFQGLFNPKKIIGRTPVNFLRRVYRLVFVFKPNPIYDHSAGRSHVFV